MTNADGTPAGWYHAPGDAEGTNRYWDGSQWIGEPQAVQQQSAAAPGFDSDATVQYNPPQSSAPPSYEAPGAQPPPSYAAPDAGFGAGTQTGGGFGAAAPAGYQAFGAPSGATGTPAEWVQRLIAYLIDVAPIIAAYIVFFVAAAISDVLGLLMLLVLFVGGIGYWVWNLLIKQGSTGQTIGKEKQGIKLVSDATGQPIGAGMVFVRYLVGGLLSTFTCGIGGVLDFLWPLWDPEKKRLTDKILKFSVVKA
jgi:uncharacterized RDD family membrane protein YckC